LDPCGSDVQVNTESRGNCWDTEICWNTDSLSSLSSNEVVIYVNGALDVSRSTAVGSQGLFQDNSQHLYLGGPHVVATGYYQGALDELRIWNVARNESQIHNELNCQLIGNEPGLGTALNGVENQFYLVAYYTFAEGNSQSLLDYTGNGNNCTLISSANKKSVISGFYPSNTDGCVRDYTQSCRIYAGLIHHFTFDQTGDSFFLDSATGRHEGDVNSNQWVPGIVSVL
jgi:hypothetical protein